MSFVVPMLGSCLRLSVPNKQQTPIFDLYALTVLGSSNLTVPQCCVGTL